MPRTPRALEALHIIETEDDRWLGSVGVEGESHLVVHTNLVGRPVILNWDDVVSITLAEGHPDVVEEMA